MPEVVGHNIRTPVTMTHIESITRTSLSATILLPLSLFAEDDIFELQPLIVMLVIPFGISGAIFGHWLLGFESLWGKREDKDGADGTDFRTQFTSRFSF